MIHLKSVMFGLLAVLLAAIATAMVMIAILVVWSRNLPPGAGYGWDPVSFYRHSLVGWAVVVLAFLIGYVWEYRREMAHR